jgi:NAD(P)-dependent dehydrogenase (short-subunit alcohol dehydrogenase family)
MTNTEKTILITGTSSGIGKATALYLAKKNYTVLATVRKKSDADILNGFGLPELIPVCPLDLTKNNDITAVSKIVAGKITSKEIPPLYSIFFVAGGGEIAPIELMNIEDFRNELEKRITGNIALLQKMLPFLRQTKGRILWISTPAILPSSFIAEIHAADFAVNYVARTLNLELYPDGIKNILIRCGGIDTPSPERTEKNIVGRLQQHGVPEVGINLYRNRLQKFENQLKFFSKKRTNPEVVAKTVEKALSAKNPKTRYQVGYMSKVATILENLPQSWTDSILLKREL